MVTPKNHSRQMKKESAFVLWFKEIGIHDIPLVGGKNASLGEMYRHLVPKGIHVPNGFAITVIAYREFLKQNKLDKKIKQSLQGIDSTNVRELARIGAQIRGFILHATIPKGIQNDICRAYRRLGSGAVAVRSSATAEDLPEASFAGQQESYLNVHGEAELLIAVKKCIASIFTDRAISYRETKGFDHMNVALSVGVQTMVRSDLGVSGVLFTLDTESGFPGVVLINASYGLGEAVVKGQVTPDQYYLFKDGVMRGKRALFSKILGTKEIMVKYATRGGGTKQIVTPARLRDRFALSEDDALVLARWGILIEQHYHKPQDIEWAKDGETGELFVVQARPETVKSTRNLSIIEEYRLKQKGNVLTTGIAIGQRIGAGHSRVIDLPKDMSSFKKGEVLVTRMTDPDWEPIMRLAAAIITEEGGKTSHAAIVSRELGVPCVVGVKNARKRIRSGVRVTVSCAEGEEGRIYRGLLPFEVKKTEIKNIAKTKTKIMMNVGDPTNAFSLSFLPNDGVGLAREEFIFTNFIRVHPLALIHYKTLKDRTAKKKIAELTRGYPDTVTYGIEKLAEGIGRIAVAFYPKPVIIRFSDFKTNEYATLIGGRQFEPKEENPMLGWRGASRYYSKEYRPGFRLECEAIKKVRNEWGLTNVITMIPFCRTPEEGKKVLETMEEFGLKRGENGLKVCVMCEIPSNVILADEFAKLFDGFSIGSNDLTQLTLGVDRDSARVSHVYSEKNDAVQKLIVDVITTAHRHGRHVGLCGQAPSDHPEFADFLVSSGIDSISLNPDSVLAIRERLAVIEKDGGKNKKSTSRAYLSIVAAVGLLASGFIALGAGCIPLTSTPPPREVSDWSPRSLRGQFLSVFERREEKQMAERRAIFRETSFAQFTIQYPMGWSIEHEDTRVLFSDPMSEAFFFVEKKNGLPPASETGITIIVPTEKRVYLEIGGSTPELVDQFVRTLSLEDET